jgi:HTH-type transcriptional regulator/antitoxin HigA
LVRLVAKMTLHGFGDRHPEEHMEIKPIRSAADHRRALKEIEGIFDAVPGTPDGDRFEVLATLVEVYEAAHHQICPPDPVEAILYHLESHGLAHSALEPCIGSKARVSEILNRRRHLTIAMIRALHKTLGIPAEVLIRPYRLRKSAA